MSFGVYKVVIENIGTSERKTVYEYGEDQIDAIQYAVKKLGNPSRIRASAQKVGNAIDLLDAALARKRA